MHLAQNIPQRVISLGKYEFVSFVQGAFERTDINKQIVFLVKHDKTGETKMAVIKIDPWKAINTNKAFDMPETVFVFEGNVA